MPNDTATLFDEDRLTMLQDALGREGMAELIDVLTNDLLTLMSALRSAVDREELEEALSAAHQLKGAAANAAASGIAHLAAQIDRDVSSVDALKIHLEPLEQLVSSSIERLREIRSSA